MAFGHRRVFTPGLRFVCFGRKADIGVRSPNRPIPAENRSVGYSDSRPLNPQVQTSEIPISGDGRTTALSPFGGVGHFLETLEGILVLGIEAL